MTIGDIKRIQQEAKLSDDVELFIGVKKEDEFIQLEASYPINSYNVTYAGDKPKKFNLSFVNPL